ncbi:MAG: class I SAM-dependent methyltransferase [Acidimicrobiales bacterium]|nr:class I SAM-dependent methyltransferase [Acidimicrobiales bacterium]
MKRTGVAMARDRRRVATSKVIQDLGSDVVEGFGVEWARFTNQSLCTTELQEMFELYTSIFPWDDLSDSAEGFDAGCGSGRWARFFAPRVGLLHCVDASVAALEVARVTLAGLDNVEFRNEDLSLLGLDDNSCDFGYCLGVLHHIPDTERALATCVAKLKPGAPFLVYLYYDLEGRGLLRRHLLSVVTMVRSVVARLPSRGRAVVADVLAVVVYWPLARVARLVEKVGRDPSSVPLFQYRHRSFYVMRNDSLDRFGTRLEKRYSKEEVRCLLEETGLEKVQFADGPPWWVAVGWREMVAE